MPKKKVEVEVDDLLRINKSSNSNELSFFLPIPPSVNHMYMNTYGGGKRLTPKAEAWVKFARRLTNEAVQKSKWNMERKGYWLVCEMVFWFPDKRKRDSHNSFKCMFDALEGIVYENDQYVLPRVMHCGLDRDNPRIELRFIP